ncbi:hypothetical protein SELMODRAFT_413514 [Selaginella moellendorffii]|uniref:Uncharacterized protein n=1 Tax=Selaginella moellendorffii TaxID=88036 RepID=D8RQI2_SELML|nr:hypothetical protein SELMODRAFT_413514 [Selaginella moellendorffii]
MDITGVEEQGDSGDELHQVSLKTSLSPEILASGYAAMTAEVLKAMDSANFIMLQHEEVSALQDATTTLEVQWLKHKLLGFFGMESTTGGEIFLRHVLFSQAMPHWQDWESVLLQLGLLETQYEGSINMPLLIVESTIAWFIGKKTYVGIGGAAQQLKELFDTAETLYCKFSHFCIEKAILWPYRLARTYLKPSCILEATIDVAGPYAKAIREVVCQIPGSGSFVLQTCGLFMLREGAMYWHPKMKVHSRMLRQEEYLAGVQLQHWQLQLERFQTRITDDLPEEDCMRWTSRHAHHIFGMHSTNCKAMEACVATVALPIHRAKCNGKFTLRWLPTLNTHGSSSEALQESSIVRWAFIHWDKCFVTGLLDMSPKELSKFHHFAVDSLEF